MASGLGPRNSAIALQDLLDLAASEEPADRLVHRARELLVTCPSGNAESDVKAGLIERDDSEAGLFPSEPRRDRERKERCRRFIRVDGVKHRLLPLVDPALDPLLEQVVLGGPASVTATRLPARSTIPRTPAAALTTKAYFIV